MYVCMCCTHFSTLEARQSASVSWRLELWPHFDPDSVFDFTKNFALCTNFGKNCVANFFEQIVLQMFWKKSCHKFFEQKSCHKIFSKSCYKYFDFNPQIFFNLNSLGGSHKWFYVDLNDLWHTHPLCHTKMTVLLRPSYIVSHKWQPPSPLHVWRHL